MVRTKVFVGNLAFSTKEPELAAAFATAGKVIGANIITRGPRSLGYGFVEMESEEDAKKAVELMNKKELNGRQINVEVAKPQEEGKEREPRVQSEGGRGNKRYNRGRRGFRKRNAEGEEGADKAEEVQESNDVPNRRPRRKNRDAASSGQRKPEESTQREESKTTLFVANLPFALDDDGFAKVVSELGVKPKTAHVVKKRNGRSKGYGFVEFENEADQKKALDGLNKKVVDSRELSVKIALTEQAAIGEEEKPAQPAEKKAAVPAEKKAVQPAEKKATPPAEKKAAPAEKKAAPAEKKAAPAEKKTASPAPAEKKTAPAEKKATPPAEKKRRSLLPKPLRRRQNLLPKPLKRNESSSHPPRICMRFCLLLF